MEEEVAVDSMLTKFVAGRDVMCPGCGYNVRDLQADRCPECGDQLEVALRLSEPKQAAAIAGLIGLSAGCGLGGLLLIYLLIVTVGNKPIGEPVFGRFFWINSIGCAAHGIALAIWLRQWKRIRRASLGVRIILVGLCWAMPIVFVTIFAAYIK